MTHYFHRSAYKSDICCDAHFKLVNDFEKVVNTHNVYVCVGGCMLVLCMVYLCVYPMDVDVYIT